MKMTLEIEMKSTLEHCALEIMKLVQLYTKVLKSKSISC